MIPIHLEKQMTSSLLLTVSESEARGSHRNYDCYARRQVPLPISNQDSNYLYDIKHLANKITHAF